MCVFVTDVNQDVKGSFNFFFGVDNNNVVTVAVEAVAVAANFVLALAVVGKLL